MYQGRLDNLLPASFRGVPFYVETDTEDYARRIATHEYPMRDTPYHEDLGERYKEFKVNGYVASSASQAEKEAIVAACRQRGNGLLQLPAKTAFLAVCMKCTVQRSLVKQGYFDIVMEFHADDGGTAAQAPVAVYEQLIASAAIDAVTSFTIAYDSSFNAFGVLPYVVSNLVGIIQDFSDNVVSAVEGTPTIGSLNASAAVIRDALGIFRGASTYVQPLGYGTLNDSGLVLRYNGYSALTGNFAASAPTVADVLAGNYAGGTATSSGLTGDVTPLTNPLASALVPAIAGVLDAMTVLFAPADAVEVMALLGDFSSGETVAVAAPLLANGQPRFDTGSLPSVSDQRNQDSATLINETIRAFATMQYGRSVAATDFTNRADAVQTRADVVEKFNARINASFDEDTSRALTQIRDLTVRSLCARITTLADKQTVDANASMPSLFWAYRLYADAERAQQLIDLNDAPCPAFMPSQFEALVS